MSSSETIKAVAAFEALKGALVLTASSGLLLVHPGLHSLAARLVEHTHLNPASKYPQIFLDAATHLQDTNLVVLAFGAACYSALRFIEAYGLYRSAAWAEVLAALSGAIYVPFEVVSLLRKATWLSAGSLVLNLAVVIVMVVSLLRRRRGQSSNA
ncbi:DUF2127 domain-containing protein [Povalibacter sp.]|uniref:DUF2127 domain-containing protein n=1 Tax=Povalibacter sp. TaxID=1962978 RepID=UPI002F42F184